MGHPSDFLRPLLQHRLLGTEFGDEFVTDDLTPLLRKLQLVPNTSKRIALGNSTGIALINRCSQGHEFRLKLPFLALQCSQCCAHNLTGVFVTATFNLLRDEAIKFIRKVNVSCWHDGSLSLQIPRLAKIANRATARPMANLADRNLSLDGFRFWFEQPSRGWAHRQADLSSATRAIKPVSNL
jgi:hypothetical protein